jgi:S1-C subfamily serine protease/pSer/pThr/pTyr-binding forkhead associated (FHA) protein
MDDATADHASPDDGPRPEAAADGGPGGVADDDAVRLLVRTGPDAGRAAVLPEDGLLRVGRGPDQDLVLTDPRVSNRHAELHRRGDEVTIEDVGSANGTLVDGEPLDGRHALRTGAEIQLGETVVVLARGAADRVALGPTPTVFGAVPTELRREERRSRRGLVAVGAVALLAAVAAAGAVVLAGSDERVASPGPAPDDGRLSVQEIVRSRSAATVHILNLTEGGGSTGSGSVVDARQGLVLSNNHVATGGDLTVRNEALGRTVRAKLVAAMPCEDLALVQIVDPADREGLTQVEFADSARLQQGDPVVAMGFPGSAESGQDPGTDELSATDGIVSKVETTYDVPTSGVPFLRQAVQHTASVNPGNSGGPLFDGRGRQVGVNTAIFSVNGQRAVGEDYAIGSSRVLQLLPQLREGRSPKWIGASLIPVPVGRDDDGSLRVGQGVVGVTPGSPAAKAGIGAGVLLTAVDGKPVTTLHQYCELMPDDGREVRVTVADPESGRTRTVTVPLAGRASAAGG